MRLQEFIIALVIFTTFVIGVFTLTNTTLTGYGTTELNGTYYTKINKTNELNAEIVSKYDRLQNLSSNSGSAFNIITLIPDALSIVKDVVVLPFTVVTELLDPLATYLELPVWFVTFIISIISILLIFAIINAILRWET